MGMFQANQFAFDSAPDSAVTSGASDCIYIVSLCSVLTGISTGSGITDSSLPRNTLLCGGGKRKNTFYTSGCVESTAAKIAARESTCHHSGYRLLRVVWRWVPKTQYSGYKLLGVVRVVRGRMNGKTYSCAWLLTATASDDQYKIVDVCSGRASSGFQLSLGVSIKFLHHYRSKCAALF
jgi:hypothetical protein